MGWCFHASSLPRGEGQGTSVHWNPCSHRQLMRRRVEGVHKRSIRPIWVLGTLPLMPRPRIGFLHCESVRPKRSPLTATEAAAQLQLSLQCNKRLLPLKFPETQSAKSIPKQKDVSPLSPLPMIHHVKDLKLALHCKKKTVFWDESPGLQRGDLCYVF